MWTKTGEFSDPNSAENSLVSKSIAVGKELGAGESILRDVARASADQVIGHAAGKQGQLSLKPLGKRGCACAASVRSVGAAEKVVETGRRVRGARVC